MPEQQNRVYTGHVPPSLEYESPPPPPARPWYARMPVVVLFLIIIVPGMAFTRGGRTLPAEKWSAREILLPAVNCPPAVALALMSFHRSSRGRRVGLLFVLAAAFLGLAVMLENAMTHG